MIRQHIKTWWDVIANPKGFFENKPVEEWCEGPLTFLGTNALIFAFFATLIVFLNQYILLGAVLIGGIKGFKMLIVLPVLIVLAFCFFMLTFLVAAGCMLAVFLAIFYGTGALIHFLLKMPAEKENLFETIKDSLYSSAVILFGAVLVIMLYPVKKGLFTFSHFMLGYYVVYFGSLLYLYGLLSFAAGRLYASPKVKIWSVTLIPILLLFLIGIGFGLKILPKLAPLIV